MKNVILSVVLCLSVAAHAALWIARKDPDPAPWPLPLDRSAAKAVEAVAAQGEATEPEEWSSPELWAALQGDTLDATLARLRSAGFPERVVRAVAYTEVKEQYRTRIDEMVAQVEDFRFWDAKDAPFLSALNRDYGRLQEELNAEVAALVGTGIESDPFRDAMDRRRFGDLPAEQLAQLREITGDYGDLKTNIFQTNRGVMAPEDGEQLRFLEAEEARDLAALLSPEQLVEYQLRNDREAQSLRNQLAVMGVTEEEFRAIYAAGKTLDARSGPINAFAWDAQTMQARQSRTQELRDALAGSLAPERLELLEQAIDPRLMMLNNIVARYEREPQAAREAMRLQTERTRESLQLRNDQAMDEAARAAAFQQLRERTVAELETLLGPEGLATYRRMGGQWIDVVLTPAPAPTARPGGG